MILKKPLNYAGRLWEAGSNVKGQLPMDFILELQANGAIEDSQEQETEGVTPAAVSAADFGAMGAEEQKSSLNHLSLQHPVIKRVGKSNMKNGLLKILPNNNGGAL